MQKRTVKWRSDGNETFGFICENTGPLETGAYTRLRGGNDT